MEEASAPREGQRRRRPRKKPVSDQACSTEHSQSVPHADNNSTTREQPLDFSIKAEQPRKKRTRKPKKAAQVSGNGEHVNAIPLDGNNIDNQQLPVSSQPPTWQQQQRFLNVDAPNFQPNFPSPSGGALESIQGGKNTTAKPKPKKRKPQLAAGKNTTSSTAAVGEEQHLLENDDEEIDGEEAPHCLLCCSPMALASFGSCGHLTACGPCCLRLRMCYKRTDCPLCKTELSDVVIAPWRQDLPDFSFYLEHPESVARSRPNQLGPGCILADKWQPKNRRPSSKLLHDLERSTGIACSICDKAGARPFSNQKELANHVHERHNKYACGMCLREGRTFPLDIPLYDSKKAVQEHTSAVHPRCDFCRGRTFFDGDSLWTHMMDSHHRCHLCDPGPGGSDSWFADARNLRAHLAADHFACDDGDCAACFVAFRTAEELRRHHIERHSARMPRWNPAAARPMHLDIQFVRRPAGAGVSAVFSSSTSGNRDSGGGGGGDDSIDGRGSRGRGRQRRGRQGAAAADAPAAGADTHQQQINGGNRFRRQAEFEHETDGGMRIIDDDLGMIYEANNQFSSGGGGGGGAGYRNSLGFGGYSNGIPNGNRHGSDGAVEAFPSLAASAAEALADSNQFAASAAAGGGNGGSGSRRPPPLVKHTLRCPCGRRVTYPVIEEGQPVPSIECDAVCRLEGRKKKLADAFGVDDPDRHISSFERRAATWSGMLLDAAKRNPTWVETIEKELASFIANKDVKRHALPAMPKTQRAIVYGMAEQYGVAAAAMGVEPRRFIELFKTGDSPGLPSKLLSKMALTISQEEISAMLEAAAGFPIRFLEVAPTTDLQYYLRRWEPRFKVEWQGGSQATVTFEKEEEMKEALDVFGGGIRGLFRVDRGWHPRTGISTTEAANRASHIAPWSEASASTGGGRGTGGATGGQWRAVAGSTGAGMTGLKSGIENGHGDAGDGSGGSQSVAVPSGWAVIGGKKAVKPRVVASAVGSNNGGAAPGAQFSALSLADNE